MVECWENKLYLGDNLKILRDYVPDESVDLIYLDPPFNSKATYNAVLAEQNGTTSQGQIKAFDDTWHWGMDSEETFHELVTRGPGKLPDLIQGLRAFLGTNNRMAYLAMMAIRLVELRRVLKTTGSIYLHCDSKVSHYLKLLMDAVFGPANFQCEIVWKRSYTKIKALSRRFLIMNDYILHYAKDSEKVTYNRIYGPYTDEYKRRFTREDDHGKYYWSSIRTYSQERYERLKAEGRVRDTPGRIPQIKIYQHEGKGVPPDNLWTDIDAIHTQAKERLGYPTQKPEALLERITESSSNEGDLVLDPFCGSGTTIAVAERLNRRWIGIDNTNVAVSLVRHRLRDSFGPDLAPYVVFGDPKDLRLDVLTFRRAPRKTKRSHEDLPLERGSWDASAAEEGDNGS